MSENGQSCCRHFVNSEPQHVVLREAALGPEVSVDTNFSPCNLPHQATCCADNCPPVARRTPLPPTPRVRLQIRRLTRVLPGMQLVIYAGHPLVPRVTAAAAALTVLERLLRAGNSETAACEVSSVTRRDVMSGRPRPLGSCATSVAPLGYTLHPATRCCAYEQRP